MEGKWQAIAELIIYPSYSTPMSAAHIASMCLLSTSLTKMTFPNQLFSLKYSRTYFSPSLPEWRLITVTKSDRGNAFDEREVGAEYFRRNSLIPLRALSHENSASTFSLPGEKKMTVCLSSRPFSALHVYLMF